MRLRVMAGPHAGEEFVFDRSGLVSCGRLARCQIRLSGDAKVSRLHCWLDIEPPRARLLDAGSRNGTYVNGILFRSPTPPAGGDSEPPDGPGWSVELTSGDEIQIGTSLLRMLVDGPAAEPGGSCVCPGCGVEHETSRAGSATGDPVRLLCHACRQDLELREHLILIGALAAQSGERPGGLAGGRIVRRLGCGSFGAVYLVRLPADPGYVAVKLMRSRILLEERARSRFLREIEAVERLSHPNIVRLLDHGSAEARVYFVMEYCDGGSLKSLAAERGGRLPLSEAGPLLLQVLEGLAFAHRRSFVHRDIKPSNILLAAGPGGVRAKLADFGLAKNFLDAGHSGMTVTGSFAGTPGFIPREQVVNFKYVRPASDVWSVAATFYWLLTGLHVKQLTAGGEALKIMLHAPPVPIRDRDPSIPEPIAAVFDRALSEEVDRRYPDAGAMSEALAGLV